MIICYDTFKFNSNNIELQGYCWEPQCTKAVIVLIHGMGAHANRFEDSVIKHLLKANYAILALDLYGHGRSKGKRGHCPSYKALLEAVDVLVDKAQELFLSQPIFVYGHSLGANIAINYVLANQSKIKGLVASSPFLRLAFDPPKWKISLGKVLFNIKPSLTLVSELDVEAISRDPLEVKRYVDDVLVHDKVSPMYLFPILEAGANAIENASKLNTKSLFIHGTADRLTDHKATMTMAKDSNASELKLFEGGYHELHHDLCRTEFIDTVINWLEKQ